MEVSSLGMIMGFVGMALMVGMSGLGCAIGAGNIPCALVGALKKRPDCFGSGLVLSAVPSTQGLYGFVGFVIFSGALAVNGASTFNGALTLGAGIALGTVCLVSAIFQANICVSGMNAIGNGNDVFGNTLILIAFPEFFAIMSLVTAILISGMMRPAVGM
ncbi:MAG: ATPase [Chitinivibrionia bacterium]|nr:ATPase [Chitinivibrionia bacterium]